jgi:hypothetical protein
MQRVDAGELAVRAVAGHDDTESTALLEAIADVATASRLVADADPGTAAVYRAAGFTAERGTGRLVRTLAEQPAPREHARATSLNEIEASIRDAWGRDTSDDPHEWSETNRARGQCAVTALVVRELLGGEILVANVLRGGARVERHAWNRLPSGLTIDLTREQFLRGERFGEPRVEEPILTHRYPERLATLRERVRSRLRLDEG